MNQREFGLDENERPGAWPASLQTAADPEPSPGDYGPVEMPGAPAHLQAMLPGWRFSHAVIYAGDGHLAEAWFDRVRERDVAAYPVRDTSWLARAGRRTAPVSCRADVPGSLNTPSDGLTSRTTISPGLRNTSGMPVAWTYQALTSLTPWPPVRDWWPGLTRRPASTCSINQCSTS